MLDTAGRHVTDRIQFGRPVATFQAVRHRLADVHVAVAAARAVLGTAGRVPDPLAADGAKALAGRAGRLAAQHCLQVTGAIGFTWEHELHRCIRRAHLLDALYGSADALCGRIGAALLAQRTVPRIGVMGP
jgi:alkylation response protein AidB-like acyl-CoA dehydrogenase